MRSALAAGISRVYCALICFGAENDEAQIHTSYVWAIAFVAALGGLLFGYDWVVIGEPNHSMKHTSIWIQAGLIGWANAVHSWDAFWDRSSPEDSTRGSAAGRHCSPPGFCLLFPHLYDGLTLSPPLWLGEIVGGVAIGGCPQCLSDLILRNRPARWRGRLVSLNHWRSFCGIMAAQIVNWLIAQRVPEQATKAYIAGSWNGHYGWRWMFTAVALPAIVFVACALFIPRKPALAGCKGQKWTGFSGSRPHWSEGMPARTPGDL